MKTYFVICSVIYGGFWDSRNSEFGGILFATRYKNRDDGEILKDLELASKGSYCYVQQIYTE